MASVRPNEKALRVSVMIPVYNYAHYSPQAIENVLAQTALPPTFLVGNVVVGPGYGNIGGWLRQTGNPVLGPPDGPAVSMTLNEALALSGHRQGEANRRFATTHWATSRIGEAHARLYASLTCTG